MFLGAAQYHVDFTTVLHSIDYQNKKFCRRWIFIILALILPFSQRFSLSFVCIALKTTTALWHSKQTIVNHLHSWQTTTNTIIMERESVISFFSFLSIYLSIFFYQFAHKEHFIFAINKSFLIWLHLLFLLIVLFHILDFFFTMPKLNNLIKNQQKNTNTRILLLSRIR